MLAREAHCATDTENTDRHIHRYRKEKVAEAVTVGQKEVESETEERRVASTSLVQDRQVLCMTIPAMLRGGGVNGATFGKHLQSARFGMHLQSACVSRCNYFLPYCCDYFLPYCCDYFLPYC